MLRNQLFHLILLLPCIFFAEYGYALSEEKFLFGSVNLTASGECPFSVTGGPKATTELKIHAYGDNDCNVDNNQFWFLGTESGSAIMLPSGTYSFSDNPRGQHALCNQVPSASSFKISQYNGVVLKSVSSCFTYTCAANLITCTTTGSLTLQ